jgi:hydantoinase/carbamoylase family amidase
MLGDAAPGRISAMLEEIAALGADPPGVSRLAYTREERAAHQLVASWLRGLGLDVTTDTVGNTIATFAGTRPDAAAIAFGSHLDSVPHGGRFDGIVGVVGMVETLRLLRESNANLTHPLRAVVFAAEEGARFGEPCIGSKFIVGALRDPDLDRLVDATGESLGHAMAAVGLSPEGASTARWEAADVAAFVELHVEQGGLLEATGSPIGLVDVVSGSTRLRITFAGQANHSGATPMRGRADALMGAAEVAVQAETLALAPSNRGLRLTVGRFDVWPNSTTTIPGRVTLTVDVRDTDNDRQRSVALEVAEVARSSARRRHLVVEVDVIADTSPTVLATWVRNRIREVCAGLGLAHRSMTSGASHDAQIVSKIAPAAIVFVPSRGGMSHVPEEWTSADDIANGVNVLVRTLVDLDGLLSDGGRPGAASPAAERSSIDEPA